jgi:hypothetical protein
MTLGHTGMCWSANPTIMFVLLTVQTRAELDQGSDASGMTNGK